ncbi:MAG: deoxyribose-phosphate aldolase [Phycisphaerales bacterium]
MRAVDAIMAARRAESYTKPSIKAASKQQALSCSISMLDLTPLEGKDTPEKVRGLCRKAIHPVDVPAGRPPLDPPVPHVAAVCVYPTMVPVAKDALAGSGVNVAAVATGFPSAQYPLDIRLRDCADAIAAGADEIDMVISRGLFLAGRFDEIAREIRETRALCAAPPKGVPAHLKIILETGELETLDAVRRASDLAIEAACTVPGCAAPADGEGFIKTSTGKVQPAATMPVTLIMLESIRDAFMASGVRIGMKPAGGIRTAKQAIAYLVMVKETLGDAWLSPALFRFGASALANDIARQLLRMQAGGYSAHYDVSEA